MTTARLVAGVLLSLSAGACRCTPEPLSRTEVTLRSDVARIDFGRVPRDARRTMAVEFTAVGRAPLAVSLETQPPFLLSQNAFELSPNERRTVDVTFTPQQTGPASGFLVARAGDERLDVELTGTGVEACQAAAACHQVTFDFDAGRCVESMAADGTRCSAPCLAATAMCVAGSCVGSADVCSDGDRCTVDACGLDGGCLHLPRTCPVTSACRTAVCLRETGCVERPVDDGVACGPADCLSSQVCINQRCVSRSTPAGLADCQYTSIASGLRSQTCASTVSGRLRCWGAWRPPHLVSGPTDVAMVRAAMGPTDAENVCTLDSTRLRVVCVGVASPRTAFSSPVKELDPPYAVLDDGRYLEWDLLSGAVTTLRTGVTSASISAYAGHDQLRCLLFDAGTFECEGRAAPDEPWFPAPSPPFVEPPTSLVSPSVAYGALCATWPSGVRCAEWGNVTRDAGPAWAWAEVHTVDAGVFGGAGAVGPLFLAAGRELGTNTGRLFTAADPIVQITADDWSPRAPCLLTDKHDVWCWGTDNAGGLGQRTGNPQGLQRLGPADFVAAIEHHTYVVRDGGLWQVGGFSNEPVESRLGALETPTSLTEQGSCGVSAGRAWCASFATQIDSRVDLGPALAVDGLLGLPVVLRPNGDVEQLDGGLVAGEVVELTRGCLKSRDGGVACRAWRPFGRSWLGRVDLEAPLQLSATTTQYVPAEWCALLPGDRVKCWASVADGGFTPPVEIARISAGVRQVVGGLTGGCALIGSNLAQCWGTDPTGEGVASMTVAVPVVFGEAIRSLSQGHGFTCAHAVSGEVLCWGRNTQGQLGVRPLYTAVPVKVER